MKRATSIVTPHYLSSIKDHFPLILSGPKTPWVTVTWDYTQGPRLSAENKNPHIMQCSSYTGEMKHVIQRTNNVHNLQAITSRQPKQRGHRHGARSPRWTNETLTDIHTKFTLPGLFTWHYQVKILSNSSWENSLKSQTQNPNTMATFYIAYYLKHISYQI